ncbi:MAG: hypothetical protein GTN81_02260 [Proteobacteria bacterium]|nr:hypothetical protein [Pseudomonadota bacterium]
MATLERAVHVFEPIQEYLFPFLGFDALVSLILMILVGAVMFKNRRKNQSVTADVENLIRRYIIFRGHRQALLKIHNGDEEVKHEILKAISNSWNHFKNTLEKHFITLHETDRRARNFLLILCALMLLNSFRSLAFRVLTGSEHFSGLILLMRELPPYLFLVTGFLLLGIQSQSWGKRPLTSFNTELEALFSDMEQTQEALNNEFDPLE